jgi:CRISPR system Cascade subunit CasB
MNPKSEPKYPLIDSLEKLVRKQDRGALAALRRGLGTSPGTAMEMHRYVVPFLPRGRPWDEEVYYLVAALFAYWHQGESPVVAHPPDNLGASLARLRTSDTGPSLDLRFTGLLKSHRDDLRAHLRQAVGLLKAKNVPINWRNLCRDLRYWDHEDGWVQRNWAKSFWGGETKTPTEPTDNHQTD